MADHEIELTLKWENSVSFEMTTKEDAGPVLTIIKMDENGHISALWPAATDLVEKHIRVLMKRIGEEMAAP